MDRHFLHISDLHFRQNWPEQVGLISKAFFDDLAVQAPKFPDAYLLFSGDLVQAGGELEEVKAFIATFDEGLIGAGFPAERRLCVPGNHDISRSLLRPKLLMQIGALNEIASEETFNNSFPQLCEMFFNDTFDPYRKCEGIFAKYRCCEESLGGTGWTLPNGVAVYCLNTALCSFGGLEDSSGKKIIDKARLLVETRSLYRWLIENTSECRILLLHHPLEWLAEWASSELLKIIADSFRLVVSGHIHKSSATYSNRGAGGSVWCASPALFTRKAEALGYSFITLGHNKVDVHYRQCTANYNFVAGSMFSDTDDGVKHFNDLGLPIQVSPVSTRNAMDAVSVLQEEFDEAVICYSSKKKIWVDRDLSELPESKSKKVIKTLMTSDALADDLKSRVIRAPKQFGLTCLGRLLALEYSKRSVSGGAVAMLDITTIKPNKHAVLRSIQKRCVELQIKDELLCGLILDNWRNEKGCKLILNELRSQFPKLPLIVLFGLDDVAEIVDPEPTNEFDGIQTIYLWSLSRSRIRDLSNAYVRDVPSLEEIAVTRKVVEEIDSLSLHRTPLNCLMILKLLEQAFEDSPVNRTEMIGRVLHLLFFEFQGIPRYSTRPDLKDCEHALGYLCQWLMESEISSFSKFDFLAKVSEYCKSQLVDLDADILFSFLLSENIFVRKGTEFGFRFRYWVYYFAAHRMYHSQDFAAFILADGRYAAYPEIIEFYTGIDRTRSDAVEMLTRDLQKMNVAFLDRTKISEDFEPWLKAEWVPSDPTIDNMWKEITDSAADSALPISVKDAIADKQYDRSKPYNQELAKFIADSSLRQMVSTVKGAARALRNSDYVKPELKVALMEQVVCCWTRVAQILAVLSPLLADQRRAHFEGMNFQLDDSWDDEQDGVIRFDRVLLVIPTNIANWYQADIFSRKMGALFSTYIAAHPGSLNEALILMIMASQRPPGWDKEIDAFIMRSKKNSFYLLQVYAWLFDEFKTSITSERTRQQLRQLAAKTIAKHRGNKQLSSKKIERVAKELDSTEL